MDSDRWIRTDTILLTAGLLLLAYLLGDVLLLVFAAILFAVGLDGLSRIISDRTPLTRGWALLGVTIAVAAIIIGSFAMAATRLVQQFQEVGDTVLDAAQQVQAWLDGVGAMDVIDDMGGGGDLANRFGDLAGHVMTWGMTAFGAITSLLIIIFLTLFLAADPGLYRRGLVRIVPPENRGVVEETLSAIAHALRWWFLGQLVSMAFLGATVAIGLLVVGIELWLALALLTAILTFIPFIGPLIAAVPIAAVGFAAGLETGIIVLVGYLVIQNIEGNVLVPIIQHKAVDLAPALLISVQVLLSLVFGVVGLILAAPLTIVGMVAVQKLWVEHALGEEI